MKDDEEDDSPSDTSGEMLDDSSNEEIKIDDDEIQESLDKFKKRRDTITGINEFMKIGRNNNQAS